MRCQTTSRDKIHCQKMFRNFQTGSPFVIATVYKPPSPSVETFIKIEHIIKLMMLYIHHTCMCDLGIWCMFCLTSAIASRIKPNISLTLEIITTG